MHVTPPAYDVDPDDVDEEKHPTGAWSVGEHLDDATAAMLRQLAEGTE